MSLNPEHLRHRDLPRIGSPSHPQELEPPLGASLVHDPFVGIFVELAAMVMVRGDSVKVGAKGALEELDVASRSSQE